MSEDLLRALNLSANVLQLAVTIVLALIVLRLLRRYALHHGIRSDIAEARGMVDVLLVAQTDGDPPDPLLLLRAARGALDRGLRRIEGLEPGEQQRRLEYDAEVHAGEEDG